MPMFGVYWLLRGLSNNLSTGFMSDMMIIHELCSKQMAYISISTPHIETSQASFMNEFDVCFA